MFALTVDHVGIGCEASGEGERVALVHASASSGAQWRGLRRRLEPAFRVIAPDLFGYGGTDPWPGHRPITLADEAALVGTALGDDQAPVHLVGHSYGGAVALRFAIAHPDRVLSLTLIEPVAFHLLREGSGFARACLGEIEQLAATVLRGLATGNCAAAMTSFVDYWNGPGAWGRFDPRRKAGCAATCARLALNFHAALSEPMPLYAFRRLRMPTLLLQGDRSPEPVREVTRLLGRTLPEARLTSIPGAGHMLPLTHAALVEPMIEAHLLGAGQAIARAA